MIYLDYNSTTPLLSEVKQAMLEALDIVGNPSSVHKWGRQLRASIDKARKQVAASLEANPSDLIFTGSGTEANHLALSGLPIPSERIYASAIEHASIYKNIQPENRLPVNSDGQIDIEVLKQKFASSLPPKLVSVGLANSETGIVQRDFAKIVKMCHENDCWVHTDAVQAFGKIPVSFSALGVDMMAVAAHKIGGPKGAAALLCRDSVPLKSAYVGGGQEKGLRAGTENIPAIIGFGVAAERINLSQWHKVKEMLGLLASELKERFSKLRVNSLEDGLPNTLNISTPGYEKHMQVIHFDLNGIALSSGSACSSGKVTQSHVLQAMGVPDTFARSAIRISVGPDIRKEELQQFKNVWQQLLNTQKVEGY